MGKIRLKVVGDETAEKEQKDEQKKRREEKKKSQIKGVGLGGGQRINTVGVSEEEIAKELEGADRAPVPAEGEGARLRAERDSGGPEAEEKPKKVRGKKQRAKAARARSKRHTENTSFIAKKTTYPIPAGIELLRKFKKSNFDETVELHINTREKGVSGQVTLPHGTGKKLRIAVADPTTASGQVDALIKQIEDGKIDFDILVATPAAMPLLAKVARVLGPRGLMPNPKAGTISDKPQQLIEKLSAGQVSYKTEAAAPLIHMSVGKLSFKDEQLAENIQSTLASIGAARISSVTLKSTMSPAIRIQV